MDPIAKLKEKAREGWAGFAPFESTTATVAPRLVNFAEVGHAKRVLDVACGTGVVAITAARLGAQTTGIDLTPALVERARENAEIAGFKIDFQEGDVEALPFPDDSFDFVLSQFGHMFGPRPEVTTREMLRVLRPGGTIAFSTWPPELFTGQLFELLGRYAPPPPAKVPPPVEWGDPAIVRERLGTQVEDLVFDRGTMRFPGLSPSHLRVFFESNAGPIRGVVLSLSEDPDRLAALRREFESLIARYFLENVLRQDFLMTRATKRIG